MSSDEQAAPELTDGYRISGLSADLERLAKKEAYQNIRLTLIEASARIVELKDEVAEADAHSEFWYQAANDERGVVNRVRAFCTKPDPRGGIEGFRHVDDILAIIGDERYDDQAHAGNGPE